MGGDGVPLEGGGAGTTPIIPDDGPGDGILPADLADFDPTFDPLAAKRPKYDLTACSGRPNEVVYGAVAPASPEAVAEWARHLQDAGIERLLGLFPAEALARVSPDGKPQGYVAALAAAGFDASRVGLMDPHTPGARDAALELVRQAVETEERICVHCHDGNEYTAVLLADWVLTDYIGGANCLEACSALAARKRLSGVGRIADADVLERFRDQGHL